MTSINFFANFSALLKCSNFNWTDKAVLTFSFYAPEYFFYLGTDCTASYMFCGKFLNINVLKKNISTLRELNNSWPVQNGQWQPPMEKWHFGPEEKLPPYFPGYDLIHAMPGMGFEPIRLLRSTDFKSAASTVPPPGQYF